ncbi:exosortase A [Altererythrobacter soli]|uniref:Exosortase A n=1 Tax=Croceibacterium soli TaxID=1739690 RepID=A0A6I4UXB3_9SPHN|nr:exosortase A [Croceibacterium soli]MXP42399.1 exosortase A [Croceibacterium soli]
MPLEIASTARLAGALDRLPAAWRMPLLHLALGWAVLFLLTAGDWADMADQWWNSSTYNHIVLVPAILAWLLALRVPALAGLTPQAWWPGLLGVAGSLFLWLLGDISGVNVAAQLGAVLALQFAVVALLGLRVAAALLFPLAYMLFLVPIGDELVPALQLVTAKLTIALTIWSGVPAAIDGVFIDTPAGLFEVAEACSGVKFLIAMIALGTLVAHLCYRSWTRRAAFMAAAIALPILANGVRAWGTIYIAQSQGVEFAAGFDHIFYGWVFFALVMAALLGLGWRFFDRAPDDPIVDAGWIASSAVLASLSRYRISGTAALAALTALALAFALWGVAARAVDAPLPQQIALPEVPGWQLAGTASAVPWEPRAAGADRRLLGRYHDGAGREVDVFIAVYAAQAEGREAGASGEGALRPGTPWRWLAPEVASAGARGEWLQAGGRVRRLTLTWYRSGALLTGSNSRLKLATMASRLAMREEPTTMLILSAEERPAVSARESLTTFLDAAGPLGAWMDGMVRVP